MNKKETFHKIYYIIYKTTNIINNKEYIGRHKTGKLDDGYIGNGIYNQRDADYRFENKGIRNHFTNAVVKYGYTNFKREILKFCETEEEMEEEEGLLVTLEYVLKKDNYNIQTGGVTSINPNILKYFDLTDNNGIRHKGYNIRDFCRKNGLERSCIQDLISGKLYTSQGFVNTINYGANKPRRQTKIDQNYIIVDTESDTVYKTDSLLLWCRENQPNLICHTNTLLALIIRGKSKLALNRWWVCKEKDWISIENFKLKYPDLHKIHKVVDTQGNMYTFNNIKEFCKQNGIESSSFYRLLKGERKSCKGYKLYTK